MIALLLSLGVAAGSRTAGFVESHLRLKEAIDSYQRADIDQDGREDIVLSSLDDQKDRVLTFFYLQPDGQYPAEPRTRVPAKKDVIAYTLANVRPDPGLEIVFFTRNAAFSYSPTKPGYRDNIERLFQADLVLDLPDPDELPFLNVAGDLDGDGLWEIVLPVDGGYEVYGKSAGGPAYEKKASLSLQPDTKATSVKVRGSRRGFSFSLQSPNRGFLIDDSGAPVLFREQFLQSSASVPAPRLYDLDGDGLRDIVTQHGTSVEAFLQGPHLAFGADGHRLVALPSYLQDEDGARANVPHGLIPVDLDGDNLMDLVARGTPPSGFGSKEIIYNFFLNHGKGDVLREEPDYRLKLSGFDADLQLVDMDGDHRMDVLLNVWDAPIGPETAISGVRIVRETYLFLGIPGKLYDRTPSMRLSTTFRPEEMQKLDRRGLHAGDFDGDGFMDLCGIGPDGAVAITPIHKKSSFFGGTSIEPDSEPLYRYAPDRRIQHLEVMDLNGDHVADLLVRFKNEIAVLCSSGAHPSK